MIRRRIPAGWVLLAAPLALLPIGCETTWSSKLAPGASTTLTFSGERPLVTVRNNGPGTIFVDFEAVPGPAGPDEATLVPGASTWATLWPPRTVRLENNSPVEASVKVTAERADGLKVVQ